MLYKDVKFPTPEVLEGQHNNSRVLIIGSGHSTSNLIKYKNKIKELFNVVIVCNYAFKEFDSVSDYHLVTEKTSKTSTNEVFKWLGAGDFRKDVPRIINYKGIEFYDTKYNIYKTTRCTFDGRPNCRKYRIDDKEGLLHGKPGTQGFGVGSVMLCAIHLGTILGAHEVYTIGADLCFKDNFDHFYKDDVYRNRPAKVKEKNAHNIIKVQLDGIQYQTLQYFKESADLINNLIPTVFSTVSFYDFSCGLLRSKRIDIDEFFGGK